MKRYINSILLASIVLLITACTNKKVYDKYVHVPSSGWQRSNVMSFSVDSVDCSGVYDLTLKIRTNNTFPFKSATVIVDELILPSNRHYVDTIVCGLFDEKGKSLGKGIGSYQYEFDVMGRKLSQGDTLLIRIMHDMRRDLLPGISDVGVALTRE